MNYCYFYDLFLFNFDKNLYIEYMFIFWCLKDKFIGRIESFEG